MAEEQMQWETDQTGHKSGYEGFGAMTISILGWIIVTLLTLFCLFSLETGWFGTIIALIVFSIANVLIGGYLKRTML